ncbi:MAG: 2-dehydropantoate 2-reductase [Candidatus Omnitrophica bacterium]|nr:2-dehydropantoate 2-reductase [Candidatus Omnitrophota bacterium]MBL7210295.1 2-dehydropantoate 2-reductase [Candidatus Omnitrophota bacterium]
MKIAVIGAGAIGGLVAGYLQARREKMGTVPYGDNPHFYEVSLIGRPSSVEAIKDKGLRISGVRGALNVKVDISERLKQKADLAILAVKSQDLEKAIKDNLKFIREAQVLTAENGIRADGIAAQYLPKEKIISSIVMFGATLITPAEIVHNFEGSWIVARAFAKNDDKVIATANFLNKIFPAIVAEELQGMKYLKIFVNANNCLPAILGVSMQEAFSDINVARISIGIWQEGLEITRRAGITLVSLPDFPLERLTKLAALPILEAAKIFSGIMLNLSKDPLYGSILQSIKRGRPSEIDYINGEFVRLARENNFSAPLNEKLVEMVHQVEKSGRFLSKEQLLGALNQDG